MTTLPQIVRGMSFEEYVASPALNASSLKNILESPKHYQAALGVEKEPTMAMRIGTIVDEWVLTGIRPQYVVKPEGMSFSTTPGKAWRSAQTLPILTQEEADGEVRLCNALADSSRACKLLEAHPERQLSLFVTWKGLRLKCRMDAASLETWSIVDLKKARSGNPRGFGKACGEYDYFFSAVFYQLCAAVAGGLTELPAYRWLVVEGSTAAVVEIYKLTEAQRQLGWYRVDKAISLYQSCTASGLWPCSGTSVWPDLEEGQERACITPGWYEREAAA